MDILSLPEELSHRLDGFQLFDYRNDDGCQKNKVSLSHNTFSFLLDGQKEVITGRNSLAIENTHFLLMSSGHCLMTEKKSEENGRYRSMLLFFPKEAIHDLLRKHPFDEQKASSAKQVEVFAYDPYLRAFVDSLISLRSFPIGDLQSILQTKLEELVLYLLQTQGDHILSFLLTASSPQVEFIRVVEENKLNRLSLKELAFLSNRSVSSFKRDFEKHFQASPSKWFQEQRLEHAAYLLKNAKRPSDIYEEAGYESLSNFIQAFKNKFGLTPKQYQLK